MSSAVSYRSALLSTDSTYQGVCRYEELEEYDKNNNGVILCVNKMNYSSTMLKCGIVK